MVQASRPASLELHGVPQRQPGRRALAPVPTDADGRAACPVARSGTVTIEYQRQQAKAMQKYFLSLRESSRVEQAK